jgi:hypothetical protein
MATPPQKFSLAHLRKPNPPKLLSYTLQGQSKQTDRYLFPDNRVRYIEINKDAYGGSWFDHDMHRLPIIPEGQWNWGVVTKHPVAKRPYFQETATKQFAGLDSDWHKNSYDHLCLGLYSSTPHRGGKYFPETPPPFATFADRRIVAKIAGTEAEAAKLEAECAIYERIHNLCIGPDFLGYVVEDGRKIGFIVERIEGARVAEEKDLQRCEEALEGLRSFQVLHGNCRLENFLIQGEHAYIVDFGTARVKVYDGQGAGSWR